MELIMLSGGILVVPVLAFITSFLFWPGALLKAYNWYWRRKLGLVVRYSHSGSYRFCYSSRGTPGGATPSLLLLHGFSATKDMWLPVIKHLPRSQHVVCVDMPGHEGTSRTGAEDYSIQGQVARIHQLVMPALMVTTGKDKVLLPAFSKGMEDLIPNLNRGHIEECGHWTQMEKPAETNSILISWLKETH